MFRAGTHAAQNEIALRGNRWLWSGVQGPSAIPAVFRDHSWHAPYAAIGARLTGSRGAAIRPGFKGYQPVPFDCSLVGAVLMADQAGSIVFDIYRSSFAAFPPKKTDTLISLSAYRPSLANQQVNADLALFGWQTALTEGDVLGFDVLSATVLTSVTLTLLVQPNHQP
jgi:hypothetical protein